MLLYNTVKIISNIVFRLIYKIEIIGKDRILKEGRFILCSNHIHLFDPVIVSMLVPRQICWMAKKELFESKISAYLINKLGAFPVDREESDLSAIRNALKILKSEGVLGIFPEGTRVKEFDADNAKAGVALVSIKAQSPVLPVFIEGNYKIFSKIKIYFGEPIDFSSSYGKKLSTEDYRSFSKDILKSIYAIKYREEEI